LLPGEMARVPMAAAPDRMFYGTGSLPPGTFPSADMSPLADANVVFSPHLPPEVKPAHRRRTQRVRSNPAKPGVWQKPKFAAPQLPLINAEMLLPRCRIGGESGPDKCPVW